jgi:rhamnosyltransferase
VLIPTLNPGRLIDRVLTAVLAQETTIPFEVLIVDSGSRPEELAAMRRYPVRLECIPPAEFGQGRTRNLLAERAAGELLFFLSQDAEPTSPAWMATLAAPLEDGRVAGAYARQIPHPGADPLMRFFLADTYGRQPARRRLAPGARPRIVDIFFSNVSSAIRRDVWRRIPFRDVRMSEDQYWAHDVLRAGYEVAYQPAARVFHTHDYSLGRLFRRNFESGASLRGLIADPLPAVARRGAWYVLREAAFLAREGEARRLPYMLVYEAVRSLGLALGAAAGRA